MLIHELCQVNIAYIIDHTIRPLGYERVYLQLCQVADTLFHIQRANWKEEELYIRTKYKDSAQYPYNIVE